MTNDVVAAAEREASLKTLGHVSYLLHAIVAVSAVVPGIQASIVLLLIAFVIDLVKRGDALGSWQESHFRWRIRSVIFAGLAYLLTIPLWLLFVFPGWIAWMLISIWFLYRIVRGWSALNSNQALPA
ncbi:MULTISPECIES: DUF4870 family protein [Rubrivivax]|uniref:Transmembrane protein n=1 Tax=Rubrivivax benzoatilyticus TaxID=316997 RepID=A0ABX0HV16_9BURK|nr:MULTISPECIES: membrane protein [Rubrivivax]EGJ10040.1 hypothetical protein RBXJA2T_06915 [Rubrivivax benzoatilyticus JA2 = ATCC BAA-35]NHK97200.1 hypothetical protein [Rubrivivax benzoatilyticus]NHL23105.1 hypothetical protein [Rubrivivax benzoatilyticus]